MKQHSTHTHTNLVGHWPAGLCRAGRESFTVNWTRTGFLWESPSLTAAKISATQTTLANTHTLTQINAYTPWNWDTFSHLLLLSLSSIPSFFTLPFCPSLNFQPPSTPVSVLLLSPHHFLPAFLLPLFVSLSQFFFTTLYTVTCSIYVLFNFYLSTYLTRSFLFFQPRETFPNLLKTLHPYWATPNTQINKVLRYKVQWISTG